MMQQPEANSCFSWVFSVNSVEFRNLQQVLFPTMIFWLDVKYIKEKEYSRFFYFSPLLKSSYFIELDCLFHHFAHRPCLFFSQHRTLRQPLPTQGRSTWLLKLANLNRGRRIVSARGEDDCDQSGCQSLLFRRQIQHEFVVEDSDRDRGGRVWGTQLKRAPLGGIYSDKIFRGDDIGFVLWKIVNSM